MKNKEEKVKTILFNPDEIRKSKSDPKVYLFYLREGKYYYTVVVKHLNGDGFIITAYITDKVKEVKTA